MRILSRIIFSRMPLTRTPEHRYTAGYPQAHGKKHSEIHFCRRFSPKISHKLSSDGGCPGKLHLFTVVILMRHVQHIQKFTFTGTFHNVVHAAHGITAVNKNKLLDLSLQHCLDHRFSETAEISMGDLVRLSKFSGISSRTAHSSPKPRNSSSGVYLQT